MLNYVAYCSRYAILPYPTVLQILQMYTIVLYYIPSLFYIISTVCEKYCNILQTMLEAIVDTTDYFADYTIDHRLPSDYTAD